MSRANSEKRDTDHKRFIYKPGTRRKLAEFDPNFSEQPREDEVWKARLQAHALEMAKYQDMLMAHERYGLLVLFQAMDGAGKDATIKHVMSALDPQGCEMKVFKEQSAKELKHDYLWRAACAAPARGQIAIFNRSYYEHVLVEKVHPEKLKEQNLPKESTGRDIWKKRYSHINNFEEYLLDNGIHTMKFFLHLSKEEQRKKLLERIERPEKKWKFSMDDIEDRSRWTKFMKVYEETFDNTSTKHAPWYIIPDNNRWFARATVASIILEKLRSFHSSYPTLDKKQAEEMGKARKLLG